MDPRETKPPPQADPPPPGWDWTREEYAGAPHRPPAPDLSALVALLDSLRRMIPAELQEQFTALQRELLLLLRGLIDWQLERLEAGKPETEIEEIQID
jgi:hypothetical protein